MSGTEVVSREALCASIGAQVFSARIGGEAVGGTRDPWPVIDPTTERELTTIALANPGDVDRAVTVAQHASRGWGRCSWTERAIALRELADTLERNAGELGRLDTFDAGLPITTATKDVHDAAATIRYFAGLGGEVLGTSFPWSPGRPTVQAVREPYGVVGKIVPFNHPLKFAAARSAAALIAGNSVIVKPSEFTSLSALRLAELAAEVLPEGVFTVLPGRADVGAAIVGHPGIPRLAFTGSVATGQQVIREAADEVKHVTAELGGKNPMLVFPDVDPAETARAAVASLDLYRSPGQACWSTSRVLVHESIRGPFLEHLGRCIDELRVGDPLDPDVDMGPLAFEAHFRRVQELITSGDQEGATRFRGGRDVNVPSRGFFVPPTVFVDVDPSMRIATEEIFGPVMSVLTWNDARDAIRMANALPVGLTASVWSTDGGIAQAVARELEAGVVWINTASSRPIGTPFGGYKRSGVGREGSLDEVIEYTRQKVIITEYDVPETAFAP